MVSGVDGRVVGRVGTLQAFFEEMLVEGTGFGEGKDVEFFEEEAGAVVELLDGLAGLSEAPVAEHEGAVDFFAQGVGGQDGLAVGQGGGVSVAGEAGGH